MSTSFRWSVCCLCVLLAAPSQAVTFKVGTVGACTHSSLAAAVAAAAANGPALDTIRVSIATTLSATLDIDNQSVHIVGGYDNCDDTTTTATSTITANADPALFVHGGTSSRSVTLEHLNVLRGSGGGRILRIEDQEWVTLDGTLLSGGQVTGDGAIVRMVGASAVLYVATGSNVYSGSATGSGGGIYCSGGGIVALDPDARVGDNTAGADGGGIYLDNCTLNDFAGSTAPVSCPTLGTGVVCNQAGSGNGGGIYAANGAYVNLAGSPATPVVVARNTSAAGGGIYATGGTTQVVATDTWITENHAQNGGGIFVRAGASLDMDSDGAACPAIGRCSLFATNSTATNGDGGALAVDTGGSAIVDRTVFTDNFADVLGPVLWLDGASSTVDMEGILVYANRGSLNDAYFETDNGSQLVVGFATVDEDMGCCKGIFDTNNGSRVEVYSSVLMAIHEATGLGKIFDDAPGAGETRIADCILRQESSDSLPLELSAGSYQYIASPATLFASLAAGDYRLRRGSQAIDFCGTLHYAPRKSDIEQETRGDDDPTNSNLPFGVYDLGFDEWHPLFTCSFETASGCEAPADWSSHSP